MCERECSSMLIQQNVCDIELFVKKFKFIRDFQKVFVEWKLENMLTDNIKINGAFRAYAGERL